MKLEVLDRSGNATGRSVELDDAVFGIEPNDHAIYLSVKQYLAHQRQGTHKAKERGEIAGSTKKIKKQKGTGTARFGNIKNPIFRGGGRIFGPRPRTYNQKLNKKVKDLAKRSALAYKAKEESIVVVENLNFETPKTKDFQSMLNALGCEGKKTLLLTDAGNENVMLSARNLKSTLVKTANNANTYSILNADTLIICEDAAKHLNSEN